MVHFDVMFARFPFGRCYDPDVTDWMIETVVKCKLDSRVGRIANFWINDTPITMGRNRAVEAAKADKCHYLVMIDSDIKADAYLGSNKNRLDTDISASPFWDSSWDFILRHRERGPCMIGSPYCGPPPVENCYIFRWANFQSDHPNADLRIEQFTREEVVNRSGFEEVCCLPTGLVLIDMRVFDNPLVVPPYFTYEYTDDLEQKKASTEDCVMTRNLNIANIPLYVNWDAWSGHWKRKCVGKPKPILREQVHQKFLEAVRNNISGKQKIRCVHPFEADAAAIRNAVNGGDDAGVHPASGDDSGVAGKANGSGPEPESPGTGPSDSGVVQAQPSYFGAACTKPGRGASIGIFPRKSVATPVSGT